ELFCPAGVELYPGHPGFAAGGPDADAGPGLPAVPKGAPQGDRTAPANLVESVVPANPVRGDSMAESVARRRHRDFPGRVSAPAFFWRRTAAAIPGGPFCRAAGDVDFEGASGQYEHRHRLGTGGAGRIGRGCLGPAPQRIAYRVENDSKRSTGASQNRDRRDVEKIPRAAV